MKETLVLKVCPQNIEIGKIQLAAAIIKKGGLVAFPTETVYGLGADAFNPKAVRTLFRAKKRPLDNPPIVHIAQIDDVYRLTKTVPNTIQRLMNNFWPGPLTLIFRRSDLVPAVSVANLDTIAIRMPDHVVALALIRECGVPLVAPSANLAGKPSPTNASHVLHDLNGRIDALLDSGPTQIGVESTVLDASLNPPQILRPGGTPYETLKHTLNTVEIAPVALSIDKFDMDFARSPGLKHKHYAPNADLLVVEGNDKLVIDQIQQLIKQYQHQGKKVGVIASDETQKYYNPSVVKSFGSHKNLSVIARNLFGILRDFDEESVDIIIAEGVPSNGLGLAIMNRLRKASGHRIIKV